MSSKKMNVRPVCIEAAFDGKRIIPERPIAAVTQLVMNGTTVVLKHALAKEITRLIEVRRMVFDWGLANSVLPEPNPTENCHCLQAGVSALQKTPHIYHSYNFNCIGQLPAELGEPLRQYFGALADLQNSLTGNSVRLDDNSGERRLHPQVIQYPAGGGLFGKHHHQLEPQRIGLILALSQRGQDFKSGSACFELDGVTTDTGADHDLGDIVLFRYDLNHWVTPADFSAKFDWNSEAGRWSMVLPYY